MNIDETVTSLNNQQYSEDEIEALSDLQSLIPRYTDLLTQIVDIDIDTYGAITTFSIDDPIKDFYYNNVFSVKYKTLIIDLNNMLKLVNSRLDKMQELHKEI